MKILNRSLIGLGITLLASCAGNNQHKPPRGHGDHRTPCEALKGGPMHVSEHGPMENADFNRDGTVLREELEAFMEQGEYRRVTILSYFDLFDKDADGILNDSEFAKVRPGHSFDGTDFNGDCVVMREEVETFANEKGRSYRKIGLSEFFVLVDTNSDNQVSPAEIEAAHESGLLARF